MSATNRLKRKLGDLGVDTSSRRANENFCLIGTPLPPLEKSKDTGEFVPLWKQDVRDEKGRRRLHGAFTGGFSAGYFNTVGSQEGWTPSTFVSSRGDRAKQKVVRPEDFMDEEDLQELKDSRNMVDTTEEMDLTGGRGMDFEESEKDSIATALEATLLPPSTESAGARILKKMGWRIGQGIGPRVTWKQRKLQDLQASVGSRIGADDIKISEDDEEASKHMYAPRDTSVLIVDRKDNSHGLGYRPGMSLNETLGVKARGDASGPKLAAGFGLGALNDVDEDDLDVYDGGPSSNRRLQAYDIVERDDDDTIQIGSRHDKGVKPNVRPASSLTTFRDGRPVLAGFVLSDKPVAEDRWYALPDVPKGWQPDPRRVWDADKNKENIQIPSLPPRPGKWKSEISAEQRGSMLGEVPLPSAPRSVFEYMSQKDRERLQNFAAGGGVAAPTTSDAPPSTTASSQPNSIRIPRTEPHIAQAALRGFQPFATDPVKQSRYNAYLKSQASDDSSIPSLKPNPGQNIDEFNKELEDYAKAALLFKPISGAMAGRFTSAVVFESGPKIHEGLHMPTSEELAQKEKEEKKKEEDKISPKEHAAKVGMYGPLTRETKPWQPARLLCKRFGVKDPNPAPEMPSDASQAASSGTNWQQEASEVAGQTSSAGVSDSAVGATAHTAQSGPRDPANIGLGEDEDQGRDTLTYERPAMDVFKAIFASDDEDSDDDEAKKDEEEEDSGDGGDIASKPSVQSDKTNGLQLAAPPAAGSSAMSETTVVDTSSFKPTFIPRDKKEKEKEKKEKKEKKRRDKKSVLVSFEMDEEGGGVSISQPKPPKDKPKKKKRKEKEKGEDDDNDGMWVEKPASEAVKDLLLLPPTSEPLSTTDESASAGPGRGRKRAIDFM